jgi:hypothetical protein
MIDKAKSRLDEMPAEIQEAVRTVDLHAVCSGLGAPLSLTPGQRSALEHSLSSFLEAVWDDKHCQLDMDIDMERPLSEKERRALCREIDEKVFLKIVQALDRLGWNDRDVLFKAGNVRLTAHKLYDGKYSSHETDRIILKKTETRSSGFFSRRSRSVIHLEADYPDKGRWGEYATIRVRLAPGEEADAFLCQLDKAVKAGNFKYFHDVFSSFKL